MLNRNRHNNIPQNARFATSHFFQYGLRSFAFLVFLCVTLFYIPLYTATLPPYHHYDHDDNNNNSSESLMIKRTIDISISMRVCFEIIAPSSEIGLHPPELVRSLCRRQIPALLLVNGNNQHRMKEEKEEHVEDEKEEKSKSSPLIITKSIRPQDRPYVQKVLRHFSSIVVLHEVAFTLYESTVKQLKQNSIDKNTNNIQRKKLNDEEDDDSTSTTKFISNNINYGSLISFIDFWTAEFPIAIFWSFMQNAEKFLRVVDAVNWLRLLPSLTFLSPQVRGGIITFYITSMFGTFFYSNNNQNQNSNKTNYSSFVAFEDISWAFHFCAFVAFMEWVSAVSDRFVILQNHQQQHQVNNDENNNNNQEQEQQEDTARLVIPVYLFASQYNRKVLMQECGYLLLQILVPPFVAGVVLSGLVALAVIVVH